MNIYVDTDLFCKLVFDNEVDQCHVKLMTCGHEYSVPYALVLERNGEIPSCPHCPSFTSRKQNLPSTRTSYDTIKSAFTEKGFELLTPENEYKNNKQPLEYKCVCGSISKIRYNDMRRGRKCSKCKNERIGATLKTTLNKNKK